MFRSTIPSLLALAAAALCGSAQAATHTFTGSDDAADTSGPWVNSAAAEANFAADASAYGSLQTITFENAAVGHVANFDAAPGVNVALTGTDYGNGFSGVSNTSYGNLYGFNVSAGGSQWLGFPGGSATFTFAGGTHAFGAYLTGLQTVFSSAVTITFFDGTSQTLTLPINTSGGASYFGFTHSVAFTQLTIDAGPGVSGTDAWGVDNVSFTSAVPEPTSVALMVAGLALVGGVARRRSAR